MTGKPVRLGALWFGAPRRRIEVVLDEELRLRTLTVIEDVRSWLTARSLPPAVDDARCETCQLVEICQPSLTAQPARVVRHLEEVFSCDS